MILVTRFFTIILNTILDSWNLLAVQETKRLWDKNIKFFLCYKELLQFYIDKICNNLPEFKNPSLDFLLKRRS